MAKRVQDARPESGRQWRHAIVNVLRVMVPVVVIAGMLVIPVLMCIRGWHHAESARGYGEGGGVFTIASCGDPTKEADTDADGDPSTDTRYTCTGAFARQMYVAEASVYAYTDYPPGAQKPAYLVSDGGIVLGSDDDGVRAMILALIEAYGVVWAEVAILYLVGFVFFESDPPEEPGFVLLCAAFGAIGMVFLALLFLEYLYRHVH